MVLEFRVLPMAVPNTNPPTRLSSLDPIRTTVLTATHSGQIMWRDRVSGHGSLLAGNASFTALTTTSGELLFYSESGRRLCSPIMLSSPAAFLQSAQAQSSSTSTASAPFVLCLTTDGELTVWDAVGEEWRSLVR